MKTVAKKAVSLNDAQLMQCIKEENSPAMKQLMNRHNSHLKSYLHVLLRNSEWEQDALQDLWMNVWLAVTNNRYHENGKFLLWLNRLAYTTAHVILRCERHHLHDAGKLLSLQQEQTEELPEGNDDADEEIRSGYNRLGIRDKEIVDLHYRGMSFEEIGKEKGMKENTARVRYSRALKSIAKKIERRSIKKYFKKVSQNGTLVH